MTSDVQDDLADALLQCSTDCIKILDGSGNIRFFNENGLAVMEIDSLDQVRGLYWPSLWPEESRTVLEQALAEARKRGTTFFKAPCPTAKGTPKWWEVTIAAISTGNEPRFVVISRDITLEHALESKDRQLLSRFHTIFQNSEEVLWDIDLLSGAVWWGDSMTALFGHSADQIGDTTQWFHDHMHPDDRKRVTDSMQAAVENGDLHWEDEFRYRKAGGDYLEVYDRGSIIRDAQGKAVRFVGVMKDITTRNAVSAQEKLMATELAHRVNNTIAVISGIFHQSLRSCTDVNQLSSIFGDRLVALATATSSLLRGSWAGADLREIASTQLAPYLSKGRLTMAGPSVGLPLHIAQATALALNELATNAMKYGALANATGNVGLHWVTKSSADGMQLQIDWIEHGGPPVAGPPQHIGLGSKLIQNGIPGATVAREFLPGGFRCRIEMSVPEIR